MHIEWAEGETPRWSLWIFEESADLQVGDIVVCEALDLGLKIARVSTWPNLRGTFHHYEANADEHGLSVAELLV